MENSENPPFENVCIAPMKIDSLLAKKEPVSRFITVKENDLSIWYGNIMGFG